MASKNLIVLSLLLVAPTIIVAQGFDKNYFLNRTIQSCADVQCPIEGPGGQVACIIVNETYANVGVTKVPDITGSLAGLTWVEAILGKDLEERHFYKDFFLATDPAVNNITAGGACALFFTKVSDKVGWEEGSFPLEVTQGTCAQAMSEQCVSKLVERAENVDLGGLDSQEACTKLKTAFETNLDAECDDFVAGTGWTGVEARVLSGPGAPKPITAEQNASSNCWPIRPKSYDLTRVMRIDTTGDHLASTAVRELLAVTPILTVFFPHSNGSAVATQPEAQLTCLKAIDMNEATLATMNPGGPESSAVRGSPLSSVGGLLMAITAMLI